ncbi:membrane protein [Luteimicrobium album]|uniref:Membrane protein n=1 Tax=Luteimicrobium album TaxID=1054550 RepID=A0ABQ6I2Y1_9MICO|nr:alpha/beta-hydrolase family protein [Luteimicrobium album]GMA24972.1 membrane protein [Luteimicrobium album]
MRSRVQAWARAYPSRLGTAASLVALVFACASLTPSLIPRGWAVQGALTGLVAVSGYGIGAVLGWLVRSFDLRDRLAPARRPVRRVVAVVAPVALVVSVVAGARWDQDVRAALGMPSVSAWGSWAYVLVPFVAVAVAVPVLAFARWLRNVTRRLARLVGRVVPASIARAVSVVVVGALAWGVFSGVIWDGVLNALNASFAAVNASYDPGVERPAAAERSGSPDSLESWDHLGREGRRFVTGGPTTAQLADFESALPSGTDVGASEVKEPIRVYAGKEDDVEDSAARVVAELDRTHAWDRKYLLVVTTTGSGWVDWSMADTFELLHGGDTAIATMQYSNLPSWLSFIGDREHPAHAGLALFDAIYARWSQLPADHRPKLEVSGISLGSFGMQAAFSSPHDVASRTDGALFVGTPSFTPMWRSVTDGRDAGTPEVAPVIDAGAQVRFLTGPPGSSGDPLALPATWQEPRVVYAQHPSDGVTWWSPETIWDRPDWLSEPRGRGVVPATRWFPVVTFEQLTVDLFFAAGADVPMGSGHHFELEYAQGFAALGAPDGWTDADTAFLQSVVEQREPRF